MRLAVVFFLVVMLAACEGNKDTGENAALSSSDSNNYLPPQRHTNRSAGTSTLLYAQNDEYIIKVEKREAGNYVYKAWRQPARVNHQPSLVLTNGEMLRRENPNGHGTRYIFRNQQYRYEVDDRYMPNTMQGSGIFLEVYENDIKVMDAKMTDLLK